MAIELIYEASPESYKQTKRILRALRTLSQDKGERQVIGEMISECDYAIEWMRTGRRPGAMRGIERPYRVTPWDPGWFDYYQSPSGFTIERDESKKQLSDLDRFRVSEAMRGLSERERQCFVMYHVDMMSFEEIGFELHIGKSTVQTHIERARKKIEKEKVFNIFLK